jgi:hypothetical protein
MVDTEETARLYKAYYLGYSSGRLFPIAKKLRYHTVKTYGGIKI